MVAKITSRDYKRARSGGLRFDFGRWKEFGLGLAIGLSLSLFVLVWQNYRDTQAQKASLETPKPDPRAAAPASEIEETGQNLDFYKMLQESEVVVPEKDRTNRAQAVDAPVTTRPGVYVLQAGSYRKQEDADRVQAQLRKVGIEANVQRVAVDDDVRHRVRIGPITDLAELNSLRARLRAAEFDDAIVIRVGD